MRSRRSRDYSREPSAQSHSGRAHACRERGIAGVFFSLSQENAGLDFRIAGFGKRSVLHAFPPNGEEPATCHVRAPCHSPSSESDPGEAESADADCSLSLSFSGRGGRRTSSVGVSGERTVAQILGDRRSVCLSREGATTRCPGGSPKHPSFPKGCCIRRRDERDAVSRRLWEFHANCRFRGAVHHTRGLGMCGRSRDGDFRKNT